MPFYVENVRKCRTKQMQIQIRVLPAPHFYKNLPNSPKLPPHSPGQLYPGKTLSNFLAVIKAFSISFAVESRTRGFPVRNRKRACKARGPPPAAPKPLPGGLRCLPGALPCARPGPGPAKLPVSGWMAALCPAQVPGQTSRPSLRPLPQRQVFRTISGMFNCRCCGCKGLRLDPEL